jgi:TfoX/Sxy family transcriptional regulator of competence genes
MAYDEALAERIRAVVGPDAEFSERKMFGGLAFMTGGNMFCGIVRDELMVRVGAANHDEALARPAARPMEFTGRPMRGMVFVAAPAIAEDAALEDWVRWGYTVARALPAKQPAARKRANR